MGRDQGKRCAGEKPGLWIRCKAFCQRRRRAVLAVGITVCVLLAAAAAGGIWWVRNVKAPEIPTVQKPQVQEPKKPSTEEPEEAGLGSLTEGVDLDEELPDYIANQKEGVYTFLLIGRTTMDDNSDMLMLIVFDTNTGKIDATSIPRDTLINVSTGARKINQAIWGGVDYTKNWVRKTLGVYPNFYVMVDWEAVGQLVEAVGGVYFDVPCRMYYVDSNKNGPFKIDLEPGYQHLDGNEAMQLIRWRKNAPGYTQYAREAGFDGSNTKRTEMQQEFMVEAAKQILQVKNLPYLGSMVQVFSEYVETDLSVGNLAWFAQKALTMDSANKVTFHTLPSNSSGSAYCVATKNDQSYVTMQQSKLLQLVNTYLNPYESSITAGNLDLMRINADGTISSSTGVTADARHNQLINDVNSGLADFVYDENGFKVVVYRETEEVPPQEGGETGETPETPAGSDGETIPPEETPETPGDGETGTEPGETPNSGETGTETGETPEPGETPDGSETGTETGEPPVVPPEEGNGESQTGDPEQQDPAPSEETGTESTGETTPDNSGAETLPEQNGTQNT